MAGESAFKEAYQAARFATAELGLAFWDARCRYLYPQGNQKALSWLLVFY